jgi:hypothetical protein
VLLLAALALDAPRGRAQPVAPLVALDVSASWRRAADSAAWQAARDSARALAEDTLWLLGDSARAVAGTASPASPADARTEVAAFADRAVAAGRAAVIVTDGEISDRDALDRLPGGSRVLVLRPARGLDAAVRSLEAPRGAAATDTVDVEVAVIADAAGAPAGRMRVLRGERVVAEAPLPPLAAWGEHTARLRVALAGASGPTVLRAIVDVPGDREPRNDTLATAVEIGATPAVVFVSSAPDYDARTIVSALRGALALPARAYLRVAPGRWRAEGSFAPVAEPTVRAAADDASLLVLHGDTAVFGAPSGLGRGALALVAPSSSADRPDGEWYASAAPPSPIAPALGGVRWDSLPPLELGDGVPRGAWVGLEARLGRQGPARAIVAGRETPRRVVVVGAGGFWRWQFRGGAAADASSALWGGILDWLAAGRGDRRAVVPERAALRAGDPVVWRRGGADSVVAVTLARRSPRPGPTRAESLVVRFPAGARTAAAPGLAPGVYDVRTAGGASLLVVNASAELLPTRPSVRGVRIGGGGTPTTSPRLRDVAWPYALALALLCAEWLLRRRLGLR